MPSKKSNTAPAISGGRCGAGTRSRALEAKLKPLWAAEEAAEQADEHRALHEAKTIAMAHPGSGMDESFQTMRHSFRRQVGRKNAS